MNTKKETIVVWFSCGVASAVAAKLAIDELSDNYDITIVNNPVINEHIDNQRFLKDCEIWFNQPIIKIINNKYPSCDIRDVFNDRKYMSGIAGAPCTKELKKEARYQFEKNNNINYHILGFTLEEEERYNRFIRNERSNVIPILIHFKLTKKDCFNIVKKANIQIPIIYKYGYPNANCIGCVKSGSPTYWNLVRNTFPDVFEDRAKQSRELGCKLVILKGQRIYLDELKQTDKGGKIKSWECGIFCDTE